MMCVLFSKVVIKRNTKGCKESEKHTWVVEVMRCVRGEGRTDTPTSQHIFSD